ncbi:MAG: hypothetical protein IPK62_07045 [Bacteroidetes bacterium]|nr:hypothetical protein [Bacteroidota bacterium]MBK8144759.1 hypothetical protein [Bacteroidota bacterium]MBP6315201.1 hypothetical protein [Chitinophagaceae bacterium]
MNGAHWHLMVNHLPIIFPIVGVIVMITGLTSKSEAVKRTAYLIFILGAFATIVAMTTGEGAEEVVEQLNGVTENQLNNHEEIAEKFAILAYILGGISLLGLWTSIKQKNSSSNIAVGTLLFGFVLLYFAKQTGTTGGEIRHTEIREGNNLPALENSNAEKGEDD